MTLARTLSGHEVAETVYRELRETLSSLPFVPSLRVIRLGEDPASVSYVRLKDKRARELGLLSQVEVFPADTPEEALLGRIEALNQDPEVDGILVQLPLPAHIRTERVLEAISPLKDVDGFHPVNVGRLVRNQETLEARSTNVGLYEELVAYIKSRQAGGMATGLDTARLESQLEHERQRLELARGEVDRAKFALLNSIGIGYEATLQLTDQLKPHQGTIPSVEEVMDLAAAHRPELKAQLQRIRTAELVLRSVKGERLP